MDRYVLHEYLCLLEEWISNLTPHEMGEGVGWPAGGVDDRGST